MSFRSNDIKENKYTFRKIKKAYQQNVIHININDHAKQRSKTSLPKTNKQKEIIFFKKIRKK